MRLIDKINLNQIRIFLAVYEEQSMSEAGRKLEMSQSAVSQQIKILEDSLSIRLFDRQHQKLFPTPAATQLYFKCRNAFDKVDDSLSEAVGTVKDLSGVISIGGPPEFCDAVLIPWLAEFLALHRGVTLNLQIGFAHELAKAVNRGEIGFAFLDSYFSDKRLTTHKVYQETISLCLSKNLSEKLPEASNKKKYYEALPYVSYIEHDHLLHQWLQHHLGSSKLHLNIRASATSCQGVAQLILQGVGAGVLPSQQIESLARGGKNLVTLRGSGQPLENSISLAFAKRDILPLSTRALMDWLENKLSSKPYSLAA